MASDRNDPRELTMAKMMMPSTVLINRKRLLQMVPLSERTILDWEKRGAFPRRFAIGPRAVAWDLAEVEAWVDERKNAAVQSPAPGRPLETPAVVSSLAAEIGAPDVAAAIEQTRYALAKQVAKLSSPIATGYGPLNLTSDEADQIAWTIRTLLERRLTKLERRRG